MAAGLFRSGATGRQLAYAIVAPLLVLAILGLLWQWVALTIGSILPPLGKVGGEFIERPGFYVFHLGVTLYAGLIGFAIGALSGVLLAGCIVWFPFLGPALVPVALMLNATPIVAIAPALIVAFGFNAIPHIIVATIAAFFPMLINAITGLRSVDRGALEVFDAMSASRGEVFLRLRLPSSLPYLFSGAKVAVTAAMIGAIVSEFTGTTEGLGAVIVIATSFLNLTQMWAAIFTSILATLLLIGVINLAERLIVRW
ncbi:ABC transporter permease [Salipiger sp. P9]|uniref:ABC transporter permease n=1 Tax=Salipiger pentaromativorans TaxID=2943193 RepID=UPI002158533C|nr:ABC transporter permease [Salipiger pentaromativorans]MCR8546890.1 ABC transporter permease [Salipiger pentaromativorans]